MEPIFFHKIDDFMSNIPDKEAKFLQQAADETGHKIIISRNATTRDGKPLPGFVAVYATDNNSYAKFWNKFNELRVRADETQ